MDGLCNMDKLYNLISTYLHYKENYNIDKIVRVILSDYDLNLKSSNKEKLRNLVSDVLKIFEEIKEDDLEEKKMFGKEKYSEGYDIGYNEGYDTGYSLGHQRGYIAGNEIGPYAF